MYRNDKGHNNENELSISNGKDPPNLLKGVCFTRCVNEMLMAAALCTKKEL